MTLLKELDRFLKLDINFDEDETIEDKDKVYNNLLKVYSKRGINKDVAKTKADVVFDLCNFKRG